MASTIACTATRVLPEPVGMLSIPRRSAPWPLSLRSIPRTLWATIRW